MIAVLAADTKHHSSQSPITNHQSPITNHQSPITNHQSPITMNDLRISLVQGDTRWHDPEANREYYGALIAPLAGATDLVVLPETFASGFSNEAIDRAEGMDGPTVAWIREQARALDAAVTGSVQLRTEQGVFNRLLW